MNVWQVVFVASNNLAGSAATEVRVNTPPVLEPIADMSVLSGSTADQRITATHGDADAITFTASLPSFATLTADSQSGFTRAANIHAAPPLGTSGTFNASVTATASGLSDTKNFLIMVVDSTKAPVLAAIGNKTVNEQTPLTFTATATDPEAGQTLTFSLSLGTPAATGATINGTTGAFAWTPTEAQGPGQYPITVRVTDNGTPAFSDSETIQVTAQEVNAAPILAKIGNRGGTIGTAVTFTETATDADIPANVLTFSLDPGAPAGATINGSTGAFSFTPTTSGTFPITIRVTDNGSPALSDFEEFTIVSGQGGPPVLAAIGNKTVNELALLAFTATATDPNAGDILTFSLDAGAPAGATINGSTGAFSWTPSEAQGPGSRPITVRVTDNGSPPLGDFETITVTVNEVNVAPVLAPIGNKVVTAGSTLAFTATATDADIPANTLCFSLDSGSPPGATLTCGTGAFMWTPSL